MSYSYVELDFDNPSKYTIPLNKYRKRTQKSTKEQHYTYVCFLEKHPRLWEPSHKKYDHMWNKLTEILNTKGPRKTVDQWQTNLRDWRYSVTFKYRKYKKLGKPIADMEMKLLQILGVLEDEKYKRRLSSFEHSSQNGQEFTLEDDEMSGDPLLEEVGNDEDTEANEESAMDATDSAADISSVWFPEVKKEITLETPSERDILEDAQPAQSADRLQHVRWTDRSIRDLLNFVKMTLEQFEQPNPRTYYRNYLQREPPIEQFIGDNWQAVQLKMNSFRQQYMQTQSLIKQKFGITATYNNLSQGSRVQILTKCPYFFDLDKIFGKKDQSAQETRQGDRGKLPGDEFKLSLPSQITVRNIKPKQHTSPSPGPSRTPPSSASQPNATKDLQRTLELERLDIEIRRFELEKKRYEQEKEMERQKFIFECEMRKEEMKLRKKELENKRREVENMMQIENQRVEQEERIERYRIQMETWKIMKKQEDNLDSDESFDEAMSPESFDNSSSCESGEDAEPPAKVAKVQMAKPQLSDMKKFLKYLKDYPYASEGSENKEASYEAYYTRFLETYPDINDTWQVLHRRVTGMRHQYDLTKKWLQENAADFDENVIEKEVKLRCPFFYELDEVFRDKNFPGPEMEEGTNVPKADDSVRENRPKVTQFPTLFPTRMDDIDSRRLQLERQKLHFETVVLKQNTSLAQEKFTFECEMKKKELELRDFQIETERMQIEKSMEVQKMRLKMEEKLKMYRIEMEKKVRGNVKEN
ncbi:uncharacterized protein LOC129794432 [Lutzomyia longipalpis]|uniref:uncharacterized protein LOC129794432 n=1 Tax=Lutzomyia longipalpis TaxID=7200 RepID=UPI0024833413|nr:uncharacterized protein LOC129794432 [Lutzomyia longipalpis]